MRLLRWIVGTVVLGMAIIMVALATIVEVLRDADQ